MYLAEKSKDSGLMYFVADIFSMKTPKERSQPMKNENGTVRPRVHSL
jgi:hypothetical protein